MVLRMRTLGVLALALVCLPMFQFDVFGVQTLVQAFFESGGGILIAVTAVAPFPVDPELMAVAVAYDNKSFIADRILPRKPVGLQNFKYRSYPKGQFITIHDTLVGRLSTPNRVSAGFSELDASCQDYALDEPVPNADIANAPKNYNPLAAATKRVMRWIMLDREKRAADMIFNANNYAAGNQTTLSGSSQFSHVDSTPIDTIQTAIDACFYRPNKMVIGRAAWSKLAMHADIVKAAHGNAGDMGIARREQVADLFELDEIIVGEGWYNSAKPGQTATPVRLWGKHAVLYYEDPEADPNSGTTFGVTAQWGDRVAGATEDKNVGMRGGVMVRAGESVKELILANDLGYMIVDAVA